MTIKLSLLSTLLCIAGLTACGGGTGADIPSPPQDQWKPFTYVGPTVVTKTDLVVGPGAEALPGKTVKVNLTSWAWRATPPGPNEPQVSPAYAPGYIMRLDISATPGLADAIVGIKVGGERSAVIPGDMSPGTRPTDPQIANVPRLAPTVAIIMLLEVN